jgi:hypothetical protein
MDNLLKKCVIISCGTLQPELSFLKEEGFLEAARIVYTAPGLHESPQELKSQLQSRLREVRNYADKIIVAYGRKCYIDINNPYQNIDNVIQVDKAQIMRINANNCIDMLVDEEERRTIRKGEKVYWLSPGWVSNWKYIFRNWDKGKANETFPQYEKAIVLDGIGFFDNYSLKFPERILEFSDWLGIEIEPYKISLDRFKKSLLEAVSNF